MRSASRRGERGALLIDAFIAMAFFGVVLGTWLTLTSTKFRAIGEAERRFRATCEAQSLLAEARDGKRPAGEVRDLRRLPGGRAEVKVAARPDGVKEISVVVHWTESGGRPESYELSSLGRP